MWRKAATFAIVAVVSGACGGSGTTTSPGDTDVGVDLNPTRCGGGIFGTTGPECDDTGADSGDAGYPLDATSILARFDSDGDGLNDAVDEAPFTPGDLPDLDLDGIPDAWDLFPADSGIPSGVAPIPPDFDSDGIPDASDPYRSGEDQIDSDGDGYPNGDDSDPYGVAEDALRRSIDSDGDLTPDVLDETRFINNFGDLDGDGYSNYSDPDMYNDSDYDNDGVSLADLDPFDSEQW